jgi:hypothetical protein
MRSFFGLVAAGPAFFVSAWLLMIFAGIVATNAGIRPFGDAGIRPFGDAGIRPFGDVTSMVVTIRAG